MPEPTEHDRHTVLELEQNLGALDIESIIPWSKDVIREHRYLRLREAAVLATFKLDFVDTQAEQERIAEIKSELVNAADDAFIDGVIQAKLRDAMKDQRIRWTHGA
jgi:hypothetical protein